tara:strand:- start:2363 stop:3808 length:1446 start_codon:yes stop_codon:yes gene_type:complete
MSNPRILFWHRKDLRLDDNKSLIEAFSISKAITGVYIFDEYYQQDFNAESRAWFLGHTLKELKNSWEKAGSRLILHRGSPISFIPEITKLIDAKYVVWNKTIEPYEQYRDKLIKQNLRELNIEVIELWDHLLLNPSQISTGSKKPYTVYGPFYKNLKKQLYQLNSENNSFNHAKIQKLKDLKESLLESQIVKTSNSILNNLLRDNKFSGKDVCPCKPGEIGASLLLKNFISKDRIYTYSESRDFPSTEGTSYLSASLRFGTISIRKLWEKTVELYLSRESNEDLLSIETWQRELAWREFYQHCLFNFPELEKGPYRKKWEDFPWQNNKEWFKRWAEGSTGIPIIDASMRQLNKTGWMHNRCRMIVASFLVKDLICNWQMGETKFMELLVDGDLAANNGGWQWSASSGMDPKPLRIFNPYTQTQKFDPLCKYIKSWIPELSHLKNSDLINNDFLGIERNGYPTPIINHNMQQRFFKNLYAEI